MREINFLHFSDLHLDMPFTSLGVESGRSFKRRQDLKKVFEKIINLAQDGRTDLLLIGGDMYEHDYVRKSTINFINDCFKSIADVEVVIIPGNHDPYTTDSYYRNYQWSDNVHILCSDNPCITFEEMGVCVYGAGFNGTIENDILLEEIENIDSDLIKILLFHGTVDMNFKKKLYNPIESSRLELLDMDYIALGHFHRKFYGLGRKGIIYNPGSPEPLGFDEIGEHGIFAGSITRQGDGSSFVDTGFVKINEKSYEEVELGIDGCNNNEQVIKKISQALGGKNYANTLIGIRLKGYVEQGFRVNTGQIASHFEDRVFFIKVIDETVPDYDFDLIKNELGIRGSFTRKLISLMDSTTDRREKEILKNALYFGMEALEQGEVTIRYDE